MITFLLKQFIAYLVETPLIIIEACIKLLVAVLTILFSILFMFVWRSFFNTSLFDEIVNYGGKYSVNCYNYPLSAFIADKILGSWK
jgi:hypothetical protein